MHHGFGRRREEAISRNIRAVAHHALDRVAMNAVEMKELLDQPRRMIDGRAQLDEIRRGREHWVLYNAAQLSEEIRRLVRDDVAPVDAVVICQSHENA